MFYNSRAERPIFALFQRPFSGGLPMLGVTHSKASRTWSRTASVIPSASVRTTLGPTAR